MWCWGRVKCAAAKAIWQAKGACAIENAVLVGCACGGVCKTRITCITRKTRISSIHAGCRVKMPRKPHKYCLPRFSLPCFSLSCFGKPKQAQCSYVLERAMGIEPTLFAWEARVLPLNDTRGRKGCDSSGAPPWLPPLAARCARRLRAWPDTGPPRNRRRPAGRGRRRAAAAPAPVCRRRWRAFPSR